MLGRSAFLIAFAVYAAGSALLLLLGLGSALAVAPAVIRRALA